MRFFSASRRTGAAIHCAGSVRCAPPQTPRARPFGAPRHTDTRATGRVAAPSAGRPQRRLPPPCARATRLGRRTASSWPSRPPAAPAPAALTEDITRRGPPWPPSPWPLPTLRGTNAASRGAGSTASRSSALPQQAPPQQATPHSPPLDSARSSKSSQQVSHRLTATVVEEVARGAARSGPRHRLVALLHPRVLRRLLRAGGVRAGTGCEETRGVAASGEGRGRRGRRRGAACANGCASTVPGRGRSRRPRCSHLLVVVMVRGVAHDHEARVDKAEGDEGVGDLLPLVGLS